MRLKLMLGKETQKPRKQKCFNFKVIFIFIAWRIIINESD